MALTGFPFPYDVDNLLAGAVRILYADPATVPIPDSIADVIDMETPYASQTGWTDLGATRDSFTYNRGFATEGLEIQQATGVIFEEVTDVTRTLACSVAEFNEDTLAIIEGADESAKAVVAAAAGASAQTSVKFGAFSTLKRYRFAFIARRNVASGIVEESNGDERGRFVMGVANSAQMSADDASIEMAKGNLTAAAVTFAMFPDSTVALANQAYGAWFFEDAGTIAA